MTSVNMIFWHILYIAIIRNVEMWLFVAPFSAKFKHRDKFWLRLILFSISMYALLVALSYGIFYLLVYILDLNTQHMRWLSPLLNVTTFLFIFGLFKYCFAENTANLLFVFSASEAAEIFADALYSLLCLTAGSQTIYMAVLYPVDMWSVVFYILSFGGVSALMYIFFARVFYKNDKVFSKNINAYILVVFIVFSIFLVFISNNPTLKGSDDNTVVIIFLSLVAFFALLIILVERFMLIWMRDWTEKGAAEQFLQSYKNQMEMLRKNMDVVNVKCHDMKQQIGIMLGDKNINEHYIDEIKKVISVYDTNISTGNEYLDLLLSQKMILCESDGIELSCMIDGAAVSFMTQEDINSFFGNAIDNAIEYLMQEFEENRFIRVLSSAHGNFVTVTIENYCVDNINFASDGLPVTSKKDKDYHGFGVKSIKMIAEKYNGKAYFIKEGDLFTVSAVFKIKENLH